MTQGPGRIRKLASHVPGALALGRAVHRVVDPETRAIHALQKAHGDELFQPFPDTFEERYPDLFDRLAVLLAEHERPRVLSFGCSTGEEVRALRRRMPGAEIAGIDLNAAVIEQARRADPGHVSDYRVAGRPEPGRTYDAILALAVFRHGVLERYRPDSCARSLSFDQVAKGVAMLDRALKPGGYLAIFNAHFRFTDMAVSARYDADALRLEGQPPQDLVYGPDDRRIDGESNPPALFRKAG